jgi:Uma2 family endonuclease
VKPARRPATYEDLEKVPDTMVAEIIDGELCVTPRPATPHTVAASVIGSDLNGSFHRPAGKGGPGGWWILHEPELHLGAEVLVPDLAGWRRERMPKLENVPALTLAPDWACEVVSPRTARLDRVRKMPIYAREGVSHLWIVDAMQRTVESYRLEGTRWVVAGMHAGGDPARIEPFADIELDLSRWWLEAD